MPELSFGRKRTMVDVILVQLAVAAVVVLVVVVTTNSCFLYIYIFKEDVFLQHTLHKNTHNNMSLQNSHTQTHTQQNDTHKPH